MTKTQWLWRRVKSTLWMRVVLFAIIAVIVALLAIFVPFKVSDTLAEHISAKVVDDILSLLAASMLSVTTFSLGVMLTSYTSAASLGTPRATTLVMADQTTQNVLSVFIGVFIYSLVGIIALSLGAYGPSGRVILFFVTIFVIVAIVVSLIRWIDRLSHLGRLQYTVARVEEAGTEAIRARARAPAMGARTWSGDEPPKGARAVVSTAIGFVQMIDMSELEEDAARCGVQLYVAVLPGDFVAYDTPLLYVLGDVGDVSDSNWIDHFVLADERNFAQDPRFGLVVLSEIASRALSPAVNDPGTAIDVLSRAVRLLAQWRREDGVEPEFLHLHAPRIEARNLLEDVFRPIARDGAALIEVQLGLQRALRAVHQCGGDDIKTAAIELSREALERSAEMTLPSERALVAKAAAWSA